MLDTSLNISKPQQRTLHALAQGGRIIIERDERGNLVSAECVTRDGWTLADVDFDALQASRAHAQVANDRDWPQQSLPPLRAARVTALG